MNAPELVRVQRLDSIKLDESFFTPEGFFIDTPIVTSCGIFEYKNPDGSTRRELRLPEHVFDEESLATYEGKPVIITHNAGFVDKQNVDDEIVGTILSKGYQDGADVRCKVIIHDINEVKKTGFRELSLGYDLKLDETPGEWEGKPYDAIQTQIKINHLALVKDARAGDQARLNLDSNSNNPVGGTEMSRAETKTMDDEKIKQSIEAFKKRQQSRLDEAEAEPENADSLPPEANTGESEATTTTAATPETRMQIVKDRRDRRDQEGNPETPEAAMGVIAQQDEDIDELMKIIESLQAKSDFDSTAAPAAAAPDVPAATADEGTVPEEGGGVTLKIQTDSIDAIISQKLMLGRLGDSLNLVRLEEMKPIDAKKAIIKKVNPNMRLDGKGDNYVNAAFDAAVAQIGSASGGKDVNYQRRQMSNRMDSSVEFTPTGKTQAERSRERMIDKMMNGGKKDE